MNPGLGDPIHRELRIGMACADIRCVISPQAYGPVYRVRKKKVDGRSSEVLEKDCVERFRPAGGHRRVRDFDRELAFCQAISSAGSVAIHPHPHRSVRCQPQYIKRRTDGLHRRAVAVPGTRRFAAKKNPGETDARPEAVIADAANRVADDALIRRGQSFRQGCPACSREAGQTRTKRHEQGPCRSAQPGCSPGAYPRHRHFGTDLELPLENGAGSPGRAAGAVYCRAIAILKRSSGEIRWS